MPGLWDFTNQTAVITGGGSGVGRALALGLARCGARVCVIGRRLEMLESVAATVAHETAQVRCYQADLASDSDLEQLRSRLQRECDRVDMLIHSAGVIITGSLGQTVSADIDQQYRVNVRAPYLLTQALRDQLCRHQGQIVFINSSAGIQASANAGPYGASKHALKAVADSIRDEVNSSGVRVLSVYLGQTATPMQAALYAQQGKHYQPERLLQPGDVAAVVLQVLSLPHSAEVTDIHMRPLCKPE